MILVVLVDAELPKLASPLGENWTAASFFSGFRVDSALNFALLHASFVDELEKNNYFVIGVI